MNDLQTAAQQVLEEWRTEPGSVRMASLMMALEAALAEHFCDTHCTWADHAPGCVRAEPVQEPVALDWLHKWANQDDGEPETQWHEGYEAARRVVQIHLTAPPQRKPLTEIGDSNG